MLRKLFAIILVFWSSAAFADFPRACLNTHWKPDGCSMPYWAGFVIPAHLGGMSQGNIDYWNNRFREACNNHDYCYGTHGVGGGQAGCDRGFLNEMINRDCNNGSDKVCVDVANIYYSGVAALGSVSFARGQACGCKGDGQTSLTGSNREAVCK